MATTGPSSPDGNKVIISVGEDKVTVDDFNAFVDDLPQQDQAMARGPGRRELADYLVKMKLLSAEAKNRRLEDAPKVKRQIESVRDQVLAQALINSVKDDVDASAVKKYYDEHKADLERVHARHVLIRTPGSRVPQDPSRKELNEEQAKAKAEDVAKRLKAGGDFAKIAREESDDTGSGADGGDLGSFTRARMVAPFSQAAFSLKENEISAPVKTPFGWHIIQVLERFDTPEKLADPIKAQLAPRRRRN